MHTDTTDYSKWEFPVIKYASVRSFFDSPGLDSGIHRISLGSSHLDILFKNRNTRTLLVVFSGAVDRTKGTPPFFSGLGLAKLLPLSLISFSDPALTTDSSVRIGWYSGVAEENIEELIPQTIDQFAKLHRVKKVLLLGGSAGGFASLLALPKLQTPAEAFVMNPQTDILKYHHSHSVEEWKRVCGDCNSEEPPTTDLIDFYSKNTTSRRITYFQNESDTHKSTHADPFLNVMAKNTRFVLGNWGIGHVPPPSSLLASYLLPSLLPTPLKQVASFIGIKQLEKILNRFKVILSNAEPN